MGGTSTFDSKIETWSKMDFSVRKIYIRRYKYVLKTVMKNIGMVISSFGFFDMGSL